VMNRGVIQQTGAPREIYERPGNQFVADFIGTTNFLPATVKGRDVAPGFYRVTSEVGELKARAVETLREGAKIVLSVRPEDIQLSETRPAGENVLEGTVETKVFLGESVDFQVKLKDRTLISRAHPSLETRVGQPIYLCLDPEKCVALKEE
jgi:iron(III) transport system ATP-binding protein